MLFRRLKISYTIMSIILSAFCAQLLMPFFFCGKQGISLRGHRDDSTGDPSTNRGNFLAILEAFANRDSILKEHLDI